MNSVEILADAIERAGKACGLTPSRVTAVEFDATKTRERMEDLRNVAEGRVSAEVVQSRNSMISSPAGIVILDDSSAYL